MCITFLFTNPGDSLIKYKLILINNRDEFYGRETQSARKFQDNELFSIYSTDLGGVVKGTWLGLSANDKAIKIGNLANVTGESHHGLRGRGPIVTDWLKSEKSITDSQQALCDCCQDFSSFNFLSIEIKENDIKTFYVSNSPQTLHELPLGYTGLGNSPLRKPFKKVEAGTEMFENVLNSHKSSSKDELVERLMDMLKSKEIFFPDAELTKRKQETAKWFSSIHVEIPDENYGTRTRTIILVDQAGNVDYIEETMTSLDPNGEWSRSHLTIPKISSMF